MTGFDLSLWWQGHHRDHPDAGRWKEVDEAVFLEREQKFTGRPRVPGPVSDWADDLLRLARAAFTADKFARRDRVRDRWTRRLRISVPVTEPERWRSPAVGAHVTSLLQVLTGDVWTVEFRHLTGHYISDAIVLPGEPRASEVTLFSGGLDSLGWAATRAVAQDAGPILLVTFREINLQNLQQRVYQSVERLSAHRRGPGKVLPLEMSQTPVRDRSRRNSDPEQRLELSSRSRGLLYIAGAIWAATAHGVVTVHVPENGQLALNPPLTSARAAACSTRSVHPWTLRHLNALVTAISDTKTAVRVVNPLECLTKGEVCMAARRAGLAPSELEATLSCGKPPLRRGRSSYANCGVCFPCLVRRSGLLYANGSDDTPYEAEPWATGLPYDRGADWRALQRWLLGPYTLTDLITDTPLPPGTDPGDALKLIQSGRKELMRLLQLAADAGKDADNEDAAHVA